MRGKPGSLSCQSTRSLLDFWPVAILRNSGSAVLINVHSGWPAGSVCALGTESVVCRYASGAIRTGIVVWQRLRNDLKRKWPLFCASLYLSLWTCMADGLLEACALGTESVVCRYVNCAIKTGNVVWQRLRNDLKRKWPWFNQMSILTSCMLHCIYWRQA